MGKPIIRIGFNCVTGKSLRLLMGAAAQRFDNLFVHGKCQ